MKKRVLLVAAALMLLGESSLSQKTDNFQSVVTSKQFPIESVIDTLIAKGYSRAMIQDLFGDSNYYFPTNSDKLESVMFMIDMLISEGRYEASQKTVMIFLAFDAHRLIQEELPFRAEAIVMQ